MDMCDLLSVTWSCVHFGAIEDLEALVRDLRRAGFAVLEAMLDSVTSKEPFLKALANAMEFPEYFGMNWDAVDDCLADLEWLPAKGYVLLLHDAQELWRSAPEVAGMFVESWLGAAERWAQDGIPFHLVFMP